MSTLSSSSNSGSVEMWKCGNVEILDKDNQDTQRQWRHISTFPHFQSQQLEVLDSTVTRHCSAFMSMHTFVSITTTVEYICYKLTIMLLFCPFHSDDAFCALLPEVKAKIIDKSGQGLFSVYSYTQVVYDFHPQVSLKTDMSAKQKKRRADGSFQWFIPGFTEYGL